MIAAIEGMNSLKSRIVLPKLPTMIDSAHVLQSHSISKKIASNEYFEMVSRIEKIYTQIELPDYSKMCKQLTDNQSAITRFLASSSFAKILESLSRETPYNFENISLRDQIYLIDLGARHSFGIVEAIPNDIIISLLGKELNHEQVMQVLVHHYLDIVSQCEEAASYVVEATNEWQEYGELLLEGIHSMKAGHFIAAQTLFTVIWDSFIVEETKTRSGAITMIKKSKISSGDLFAAESISDIYTHATYSPLVSAYKRDPSSPGYSRNATIHYASKINLSLENAICAMTIATGVLTRNWRLT